MATVVLLGLFWVMVAMLYLLIIVQCLMLVEEKVQKSRHELQMLRAMGLSKQQVFQLILAEMLSVVLASVLIGHVLGYVEVLAGMSLLRNSLEMEMNFSFYPETLLILSLVTAGVITLACKVAVMKI